MKKTVFVSTLLCCGILCASPYGRALQKARDVANRPHPAEKHLQAPKPHRPPAARPPQQHQAVEFNKIWAQMDKVIKRNKGVLPGPAGVAGLRKLCGPGQVSPALLKINDFGKLTERNCAWAYVGGSLDLLRKLPRSGDFPVLFTKPRPGVQQIRILMADGTVKILDARRISGCSGVVNALRRSSPHGKHPAWKHLSIAASQIDKASR